METVQLCRIMTLGGEIHVLGARIKTEKLFLRRCPFFLVNLDLIKHIRDEPKPVWTISRLEQKVNAACQPVNELVNYSILNYGAFIQTVIDFTLVALAIFVAIKMRNAMKKREEEAPAAPVAPPEDVVLLREIRDSLRK